MTRSRLIAAILLTGIVAFAAWGLYTVWSSPKTFPTALRPKPTVHADWPVIDFGSKSAANARIYKLPRSNRTQLKVKLKNMPSMPEPEKGLFIAFYPQEGTEDARKKWSYGGAIVADGRQKTGIWEFEGEANVVTFRDQTMRAVLLRGETVLVEVVVQVESESQN